MYSLKEGKKKKKKKIQQEALYAREMGKSITSPSDLLNIQIVT
jgi:hypothetical protein